MIEIIQSPDNNRVIADANETLVVLKSTSGNEYYIQLDIFVNDSLFTSRSISKDNNGFGTFNFAHFYEDYFNITLPASSNNGFVEHSDLKKKIHFIAYEKPIQGLIATSQITSPEFYIIKSSVPFDFTDTQMAPLFIPALEQHLPKTGQIRIPFYGPKDTTSNITIVTDTNETIYNSNFEHSESGITSFTYTLLDNALPQFCPYIAVTITNGERLIKLVYHIISAPKYQPKKIMVLNNVGLFLPVYLTGVLEDVRKLDANSFLNTNDNEETYEVLEEVNYTLNSGYQSNETKALNLFIAKSIDVRLLINNDWVRVSAATKKIEHFRDNTYIYEDALQFNVVKTAFGDSTESYLTPPTAQDISVSENVNTTIKVHKSLFENALNDSPVTKLRLSSATVNGIYGWEDNNGNYQEIYNPNNATPFQEFILDFETFQFLVYYPETNASGDPLDTILFSLRNNYIYSNQASLELIVNGTAGNQPPTIITESPITVGVNQSGNGSKQIEASITDPENNTLAIVWEALNNAPITFDDTTIEEPEITVNGVDVLEQYQIKVTATDTDNNLISERVINVNTSNYMVSNAQQFDANRSTSQDRFYNISFAGGQPGKTMTLLTDAYFDNNESYAIVDVDGGANQKLVTSSYRKTTKEFLFDTNGEVNFVLKLRDELSNNLNDVRLKITDLDEGMYTDPNNSELIIR